MLELDPESSERLNWPRVTRDERVCRKQRDPFHLGLRDQDSIERVLVNQRKNVDPGCMFASDRQLDIAVFQQTPPQQARVDMKVLATQGILDCNLPYRCSTENEFCARIRDEIAHLLGEPIRHARSPKQDMSVEQESQEPLSNMSSRSPDPIRSKSGGTEI